MRDAQDRQRQHMQETIARNIRQGKKNDDDNRLRQAKSRQKRLDDRMGLQTSARGGRFKLNRDLAGYHFSAREEIDVPREERGAALSLPEPTELRFPGALVSVEAASFRYPARRPPRCATSRSRCTRATASASWGSTARASRRSSGCSVQASPPTGTTARHHAHHPRLRVGYYAQHAVDAPAAARARGAGAHGAGLLARETAGAGGCGGAGDLGGGRAPRAAGDAGARGCAAADVPLARLSGGQLVRCELARLLWRRPQMLVLDEVTTHLDYEMVAALRGALRRWEGAVVLVSHDRWFVRGVVEGVVDDDDNADGGGEGEGEGEEEEEEDARRRREVFRLKGGTLVKLAGGVAEFEEVMERRARKLLEGLGWRALVGQTDEPWCWMRLWMLEADGNM